VRRSPNESLLDCLTGDPFQREEHGIELYDRLEANDFAGLKRLFHAFYESVFYSYFVGAALARLKARGYAHKYRACGEPVHLVGVEFSSEDRNVTAFEVERA